MDTAWIQVFVLTLAECVAPAGKTVCQERELDLVFLTRDDCQAALQEFIGLKEELPNVIVDRQRTRCTPSARQRDAFASLEDINDANRDTIGWRAPAPPAAAASPEAAAPRSAEYEERLKRLKTCDETAGMAPCKIGEIIVEDARGERVEVWRRDK